MSGNSLESQPARLLIVDDSEDNLEILWDILTFNGYEVHTAQNGEEALKRVQAVNPDLILLDVLMPGINGFEVCTCLKSDEHTKEIPVIFVSSMTDIDSKVMGFKVGGVDYIHKPFQRAEIVVRVNTHITLLRLRQRLEEQNAELEHLANTDYLTELFNRRCFFHAAEEKMAEAAEHGTTISVTLFDIDYFKKVNDAFSHLVGDRLLFHVARLIRTHCRVHDVVARYGGEEFVILHPAIDGKTAFGIAEQIRKEVEVTPFVYEGNEINVTLSAGVVDMQSLCNCSRIDDLLALADRALYQAKDAGRNQVILFGEFEGCGYISSLSSMS